MEEVARDNKTKFSFSQKGSISLSIIGLGVLLFSAVVLPLAAKLTQQRVTTQQRAGGEKYLCALRVHSNTSGNQPCEGNNITYSANVYDNSSNMSGCYSCNIDWDTGHYECSGIPFWSNISGLFIKDKDALEVVCSQQVVPTPTNTIVPGVTWPVSQPPTPTNTPATKSCASYGSGFQCKIRSQCAAGCDVEADNCSSGVCCDTSCSVPSTPTPTPRPTATNTPAPTNTPTHAPVTCTWCTNSSQCSTSGGTFSEDYGYCSGTDGCCEGAGVNPTSTPASRVSPTATLTPTPSCSRKIYGDANCDGLVNSIDFGIWRSEYLGILPSIIADFNADGKIDLKDFGIWRKNASL